MDGSEKPNHQFHRVQLFTAIAALASQKAVGGTLTVDIVVDFVFLNLDSAS